MPSIQVVAKSHRTQLEELDEDGHIYTLVDQFGVRAPQHLGNPNLPRYSVVRNQDLLNAADDPQDNISYDALQDTVQLAQDIMTEVQALRADSHLGKTKNAPNFNTIAQRAGGLMWFLLRLVHKIRAIDKPKPAGSTAKDISDLPPELMIMILSYCRTKVRNVNIFQCLTGLEPAKATSSEIDQFRISLAFQMIFAHLLSTSIAGSFGC